jgi:pimeloyl-ACP methyl ester carboxylesterase
MRHFLAALVIVAVFGCAREAKEEALVVSEDYAVTSDGVKLYYRVAGSGEETVIAPFAMYHGSALDSLAKGRRVVTYDPRGRARSDAVPPEKVSLDHLLIDFDTVREAVGAEKVAIIGWSGAGMETFVYALRNPERVTRLVQFAPVPARFDPFGGMMMEDRQRRTDAAARDAYLGRRDAGEFAGDPEADCRALEAVTNPPMFADPANLPATPDVCQYPNEHPEAIGAYFGQLFESIVGYDWRDELDQVTIPRLVVHGEKDNIPLEGNEEWVKGQANARIIVIAGAGHWPHYEQPEATLKAVEEFLGGGWPADAKAVP